MSNAPRVTNLIETARGRRILFTTYYAVEGAPIGFLWWALPTLLRSADVDTERIGESIGWLVLPWAFKWLWAPLVDVLQGPRWGLRAWIGSMQVGMALTLMPLLLAEDFLHSSFLVPCLIAHAVFASTQDAAIDALMIRTTQPEERGRLAGWMQFGMLAGRSLLGGGALLVVASTGPRAPVAVLVGVVAVGLGLLTLYRVPTIESATERDTWPEFGAHVRSALSRATTWIGLAFAALAGAGFEALGAFAGPLLTERAGGAIEVAGRFFLVHAVVAMAIGGILGGRLTDRVGARRGTVFAGLALGIAILATSAVVELQQSSGPNVLVACLTATYVTVGWFTAASYALFMHWTDPRLGATQFSAYMGATNVCESWSAVVAGKLIPRMGYGATFGVLAAIGLGALVLLFLPNRARTTHAPERPARSG